VFDYAAFFEVLAAGSAVFFALSFAANSCLTLAAMASVPDAAKKIVCGQWREEGSSALHPALPLFMSRWRTVESSLRG
jgi:hypothetical protein